MSAVFDLNNKEAKRELKVNYNNEILPFCPEPKYLGEMLFRSLTYRRHLESLRKLTSRVAVLRLVAGSGWGAGATTLRTPTPAQVHSTAEYSTSLLPGAASHEQSGSGLTASAPVSDVSAPACTSGVWSSLRPVSVVQKNKPSTMLSPNVQIIDLPMDCMA